MPVLMLRWRLHKQLVLKAGMINTNPNVRASGFIFPPYHIVCGMRDGYWCLFAGILFQTKSKENKGIKYGDLQLASVDVISLCFPSYSLPLL